MHCGGDYTLRRRATQWASRPSICARGMSGKCGRMSTYCDIASGHPLHGPYHDSEYGFPLADDDALFERLILEVNQAGLSRELMLKRRESFRRAYGNFSIATVARCGEARCETPARRAAVIRNPRSRRRLSPGRHPERSEGTLGSG